MVTLVYVESGILTMEYTGVLGGGGSAHFRETFRKDYEALADKLTSLPERVSHPVKVSCI